MFLCFHYQGINSAAHISLSAMQHITAIICCFFWNKTRKIPTQTWWCASKRYRYVCIGDTTVNTTMSRIHMCVSALRPYIRCGRNCYPSSIGGTFLWFKLVARKFILSKRLRSKWTERTYKDWAIRLIALEIP